MTDNTLPDGKALRLETDIGFASMTEIAGFLVKAADIGVCDDLDRDTILRLITDIKGIDHAINTASDVLNSVAVANGENTRLYLSNPLCALTVVTPSIEDIPEGEAADE